MIPAGRTDRLILTPIQVSDAPQIQEIFPHWEIVRYLAARVPWPYPPDGALQYCREVAIPQMERNEAFHWSLRLCTDPGQLIGSLSLYPGDPTENRGFWLGLPWQRLGYMSEACIWANDFYFDILGRDRLRVPKAAKNLASRRISEKQGMHLVEVGEKDYVCGRLKSETWEITADEWRVWKAALSSQTNPREKV